MTTTSESLQKAFGYLTKDELRALKMLAQMLPKEPTVLNIGAGSGTSGLAFLETRPDLFLYTVDIEDGDSPLGSLMSERNALRGAGIKFGDRNTQHCGDSAEFGRYWTSLDMIPVDMVFVDADHSYEGCKADIEAWLPNIKKGGIIALHDYKKHEVDNIEIHPKPWPGVDQAVSELLEGKYEMLLRIDSLISFRIK